jgi:hypothetical protein
MLRRIYRRQTLTLLLLFLPATFYGQCDKSTIKGSYGFVSSARITPKPGTPPVKVRFIGLVSYDGAGNASASGLSIGPSGQPKHISLSGTYDVDAGCTGQVSLSGQDNAQSIWGFVVVNGATELLSVSVRSSDTTPFSQKKQ